MRGGICVQRKLRIGMIGVGGIARLAHLPALKELRELAELVAVADINPETAQRAAWDYQAAHWFSDYQDMLQQVDLDAVFVCTPNKYHAPATVAALAAGCHVLCEKPPAITAREAEQMAVTAAESGKLLYYGFHYRHAVEVGTLHRFIQAGELGEIYAATCVAIRRRGIPGWGVFTNRELQGGGPLIDIGVHMLDAALYLLGYPRPQAVYGATYQQLGRRPGVGLLGEWDYRDFSVEDMARGMIRFQNGASILIDTAFAANVAERETMQVKLMGNLGGAELFPLRIFQERHGALLDTAPAYLQQPRDCYLLQAEHFLRCCLGEEEPVSTPEQGVTITRIIEGLYQSAASGELVHL
jgi:predicted dehydrogenase